MPTHAWNEIRTLARLLLKSHNVELHSDFGTRIGNNSTLEYPINDDE